MTTNPNAPHFILATVKRIYADLPELVGQDGWNDLQSQVDSYITTLEVQLNAYLASTQLFGLLAQHERVRQRLTGELKIQEIISTNIAVQVTQIANSLGFESTNTDGLIAAAYASLRWEVDPDTMPLPDEDIHQRGITMSEGGIGGASKIKFTKVQIDFGSLAGICAGFLTASVGIMTTPNIPLAMPLLVAAALLSTVSALHDTMNIELSEQDASVFWGMIRAIDNMHGAGLPETMIVTTTNREREKYGLDLLNETQVRYSLTRLERIKSIDKIGEKYYRIIEQYAIKG